MERCRALKVIGVLRQNLMSTMTPISSQLVQLPQGSLQYLMVTEVNDLKDV